MLKSQKLSRLQKNGHAIPSVFGFLYYYTFTFFFSESYFVGIFSYITMGTVIAGLTAGLVHDFQRKKYIGIKLWKCCSICNICIYYITYDTCFGILSTLRVQRILLHSVWKYIRLTVNDL